ESESKEVLAAYHIPTIPMVIAETEDEAIAAAEDMGYPVVLKLHSETITHKTDVGGVRLRLMNADEVRNAYQLIKSGVTRAAGAEHFLGVTVQPMIKLDDGYEIIVGSSLDPQFGPVLLFGTGGALVEVFQDSALALPPLTTTLARRMMEQTKIYKALQGVRGRPPVDLEALELLLVRFSQLVVEQPWIKELDINPLFASSERILALDARVVLHEPDTKAEDLPQPAIRPYPIQYISDYTAEDGETYTIRPIRPEDEPLLSRFNEILSDHTVTMRFFSPVELSQRIQHERLARLSFIDYDRAMALVAVRRNPTTGEEEIAAVGRLTKSRFDDEAEFGITVGDPYQGQGLGTEIMRRLIDVARKERIGRLIGYILPQNGSMLGLALSLGFDIKHVRAKNIMVATLNLRELD
ncbi:MAG: GNAT family N-acetyltransferase, partial [Chloroflexi bacterium]